MVEPAAPRAGRPALGAGIFCYVCWGLIPLLFQATARAGANPWEITAWRALWSAPLAAILVLLAGQLAELRRLPLRVIGWLAVSALMIGVNWTVYVWAVNNGQTLQASLGYYIGPLVYMAIGALMFHEKVSRAGAVAIGLAAAGVALQAASAGGLPWVALVLAGAFSAYGVIRKRVAASAQAGLLVECLILAVPASAWLIWAGGAQAAGAFGRDVPVTLWLIAGGPATVLPLAAFAWAARRLPLTLIGFIQFIAPTMVFFIGVLEHEAISPLGLAAFALIWAGTAVFVADTLRRGRTQSAA